MKILKNKNFKFLLIGIIIILIFFLCAIDSKAQEQHFNPISYDFQNDVLYDKDGSFKPDMYNIREQSEYNGNYISYESFNVNSINELEQFDFRIDDNTDMEILDSYFGHNKVLNITDNSDIGLAKFTYNYNEFEPVGKTEFWIYFFTYEFTYFQLFDVLYNDEIIFRFTSGGAVQFYDDTGYITIASYSSLEWIHILVEFDCTNSCTFSINQDIIYDLGFRGNPNQIKAFKLETHIVSTGYHFLIDGLDFSHDYEYYKNRNLIPKKEYTNQYEVDKYEFDYNPNVFESDLNSWKQNEFNDTVNDIKIVGSQSINKYVSILTKPYDTNENGIQFDDNSTSNLMNISFFIEFGFLDEWCAHIFYIFPQNISFDYPIAIKFNGYDDNVYVYNISLLDYQIFSTFNVDIEYKINFYLNYYDNIMIIRLNSTEGFNEILLPLDDNDKWNNLYGLDCIQINNSMGAFGIYNTQTKVYNVGIYENGKYFQSILDNREFGLMIYVLDKTWNSLNHNLITVNSENDYKLYAFSNCAEFDYGVPLRARNIQSEREIINIAGYTGYTFNYYFPFLVFMLFDNFSIPYEIEIEGVSLVDNNGIKTNARYIYDNTYPNRYFFYCIDNKLYYNFSNSYKLGIETMTIVFDVNDVLLDDSFLFSYTSYITDDYNGLITLESYEFYESFNIPNDIKPIHSIYNVSLEQEFTLTEIRIHIKTDTFDFASGYTSGYIENLNLYYDQPLIPDYDPISVLELDFLESMIFVVIRLIFFLIPSLIFRTKFGNKSILPMWLLIGLILFISGLIPFWLFFIHIIAIGSMLMLNRSKEAD